MFRRYCTSFRSPRGLTGAQERSQLARIASLVFHASHRLAEPGDYRLPAAPPRAMQGACQVLVHGRMRFSGRALHTMCAISTHCVDGMCWISAREGRALSRLSSHHHRPPGPRLGPNRPMRPVTGRSPNIHALALTPCRSPRQQPVAMVPIAWIGWCQDVSTYSLGPCGREHLLTSGLVCERSLTAWYVSARSV